MWWWRYGSVIGGDAKTYDSLETEVGVVAEAVTVAAVVVSVVSVVLVVVSVLVARVIIIRNNQRLVCFLECFIILSRRLIQFGS